MGAQADISQGKNPVVMAICMLRLFLCILVAQHDALHVDYRHWLNEFNDMCEAEQWCVVGAQMSKRIAEHPHCCSIGAAFVIDQGKQFFVLGNKKMQANPEATQCVDACIEEHPMTFSNAHQVGQDCDNTCAARSQSWESWAGNAAYLGSAVLLAGRLCSKEGQVNIARFGRAAFERWTGRSFSSLAEATGEEALSSAKAMETTEILEAGLDAGEAASAAGEAAQVGSEVASGLEAAGAGEATSDAIAGLVAAAVAAASMGEMAEVREAQQSQVRDVGRTLLDFVMRPENFTNSAIMTINSTSANELGELLDLDWSFVLGHLDPNINHENFMVLDRPAFVQLNELMKRHVKSELENAPRPTTIFGFQAGTTQGCIGILIFLLPSMLLLKRGSLWPSTANSNHGTSQLDPLLA